MATINNQSSDSELELEQKQELSYFKQILKHSTIDEEYRFIYEPLVEYFDRYYTFNASDFSELPSSIITPCGDRILQDSHSGKIYKVLLKRPDITKPIRWLSLSQLSDYSGVRFNIQFQEYEVMCNKIDKYEIFNVPNLNMLDYWILQRVYEYFTDWNINSSCFTNYKYKDFMDNKTISIITDEYCTLVMALDLCPVYVEDCWDRLLTIVKWDE